MAGTKLYRYVTRRLAKYWSPEQIAGRLEYQTGQSPVSHVTIYAFVRAHPELKRYLRIQKRYRRRQGTAQRQQIREASNRRSIDERPKVVNDRKRLGDWEGDTIVGTSKDRTVTYAERRSGKAKALKVQGGPGLSKNVSDQTVRSFRQLPREKRRTITYDRGTEFSDHEHIETNLSLKVYFAHPHHPWERGTNENTNGLYRQFFPKKTDFSKVTQAQLDKVTRLLNTRPRKRHRFRTPDEVFRDGE
jgi:IS30 family transposase